jgi:hypothetical protein
MAYEINQNKVIGVVVEVNQVLQSKEFNHGEALLGLSELLGRIIVSTAANHIQMQEMVTLVQDHIHKTITIGAQATQKSLIERV